jgi:regulator of protease activity HflC (stomatin/prohibitin superfamily)
MGGIKWRRLLITLIIGLVPTAISYILGWWWGGTIFALLTLFAMCFAFPSKLYATVFTLFAVVAIAWTAGAVIEGLLPAEWEMNQAWRSVIGGIAGLLASVVLAVLFWLLILWVSTKWILSVSESFEIPWRKAFSFVAAQVFQTSQLSIVVKNGQIAEQKPEGMLAALGGPGQLIVGVGNVVVLERGGETTRILGPGTYKLKRFEKLKTPHEGKGILDLRLQGGGRTAENVRTKDGIALTIKVGGAAQIETKQTTDARPESHFAGGDATTPLLGAPEYPVYEAIVRKAVFLPPVAWSDAFPGGPINVLRDVVATYTLDEIFAFDRYSDELAPDDRVIREIENAVNERYNPAVMGVKYGGIDIQDISMPEEIEKRVIKRWTARVERELRVAEAEAERDAMIQLSEGRAHSFKTKASTWEEVAKQVITMLQVWEESGQRETALNFIGVVQGITQWVGEDQSVAMRYVEAMHHSESWDQEGCDQSTYFAAVAGAYGNRKTGRE